MQYTLVKKRHLQCTSVYSYTQNHSGSEESSCPGMSRGKDLHDRAINLLMNGVFVQECSSTTQPTYEKRHPLYSPSVLKYISSLNQTSGFILLKSNILALEPAWNPVIPALKLMEQRWYVYLVHSNIRVVHRASMFTWCTLIEHMANTV